MTKFFAIVAAVFILILAGVVVLKLKHDAYQEIINPVPDDGEQVFCTQEAKLCPDGSYVGRTGPHCEFSPCPGV